MKNLVLYSAFFLFVLAVIQQSLGQENSDKGWSGEWNTEWGNDTIYMIVIEAGDEILALYAHNDGKLAPKLSDENGKSLMTGTWTQNDGEGWFRFTLNEDSISFSGVWGDIGDETVKGLWNGKKRIETFSEEKDIGLLKLPYSAGKKGISYNHSLRMWEKLKEENGNSYIYQQMFSSWTGYGYITQIKVENGIVTSRIYKSFKGVNGESKTISRYVETGDKIGSHSDGRPAITIDELYIEAKTYLEVNKKENEIYFTTFENGLLNQCGHYPKGCADDCFNGVSIYAVKWLKPKW